MDIISSINSAFTQVQHERKMSVSSGGEPSRTQVQMRGRGGQGTPFGQLQGGPGMEHHQRPGSSVDSLRDAVHQAVAYDKTERGSLRLTTQEGDVVHLKFLNSESSSAQNQQFENGGQLVSSFSLAGDTSSGFDVVVEGDLNGEELSAIRDVLLQAREIANSFYDGDVKAAFDFASSFDIDSEQLANVNMRLSVQETYTYARATVDADNMHNPNALPPGNQIQPVTPGITSTPPAVPVSPVTQTVDLTSPMSQPDIAALALVSSESISTPNANSTPVHVAPDPVDALVGALSTITDFLNRLTESMDAFGQQLQGANSKSPYSFSNGFQLQMVSALVSQMESASGKKVFEGHALAAATINEVAMKMDAHVEDVA